MGFFNIIVWAVPRTIVSDKTHHQAPELRQVHGGEDREEGDESQHQENQTCVHQRLELQVIRMLSLRKKFKFFPT